MKNFALFLFVIGFAFQSCQKPESTLVANGSTAFVGTLPVVRAKTDSLFPGLKITSLSWAKENFFSFNTGLEMYAGYQLYKLEKDAKDRVTLLVLKNSDGHILGIDCSTLPSRMKEADTEADFNNQTGSYVSTNVPTSELYGEGDAVSKTWFLSMLALGLDRLKFQDYVYIGPGGGSTVFRKKTIKVTRGNGTKSAYDAEVQATNDPECKGNVVIVSGNTSSNSNGYTTTLIYCCNGC